ncbi:hypothetical protein FB451DRAFT_1495657 [Mycena latifolia]|nr:hypothetical protein FB451DRAFT_1495657 [Mycena latifolia]
MLSLLYLLLVVVSACGAVLSPRITYAFSITDFQGRMVNLTDGNPQPFTPVQSFTPANTTNQQWALISSMDARQLWEVANVGGNSILSHTTALLAKPGPAIHSQIVSSRRCFGGLRSRPRGIGLWLGLRPRIRDWRLQRGWRSEITLVPRIAHP